MGGGSTRLDSTAGWRLRYRTQIGITQQSILAASEVVEGEEARALLQQQMQVRQQRHLEIPTWILDLSEAEAGDGRGIHRVPVTVHEIAHSILSHQNEK